MPFPSLLSDNLDDGSNDSSRMGFPIRRCKRMTCRRRFEQQAPDLFFCPDCRRQMLLAENSGVPINPFKNRAAIAESAFFEQAYEEERWAYDYKIKDELGREVWAGDWIKKALAETRPRPL